MAATTPATWKDELGIDRLVGFLETADAVGLPTGWTEDASDPANVNGGAGSLKFDDGTNDSLMEPDEVQVESGSTNEFYRIKVGEGIKSTAPTGVPCFAAFDDESATVAFDGGGLLLSNIVPGASIVYVTDQAAAPTTFTTPLVFDHTAVTGGLYAWDGAAYVQVGGPVA